MLQPFFCFLLFSISFIFADIVSDQAQQIEEYENEQELIQDDINRSSSCSVLNNLIVKNCLTAGALHVRGNALIDGSLTVNGGINGLPPTPPPIPSCVSVACDCPNSLFTMISGRLLTTSPTGQNGPGWNASLSPTPDTAVVAFLNPFDLSSRPILISAEAPLAGGIANITNRFGNAIQLEWTPDVNAVDFKLAGCVEQICPPPPTNMQAGCTEPTTMYTWLPNLTLTCGALIPAGAKRIAVLVHGGGATALSTQSIAEFILPYPIGGVAGNPHLFDAVLAFQWDSINQGIDLAAASLANILNSILAKMPNLRLTIMTHSFGGGVGRYAIEQLGIGQFTDNLIEFSSLNHSFPTDIGFGIAGVLGENVTAMGTLCPMYFTPIIIEQDTPDATDSNANVNQLNTLLNSKPSPWASTIRYFCLAGNKFDDPPDQVISLYGAVPELQYQALYLTTNPTSDGVLSHFNEWGTDPRPPPIGGGDVLIARSNFLATNQALCRQVVPHNHLTIIGVQSTFITIPTTFFLSALPGGLPADVKAILNQWLSISP